MAERCDMCTNVIFKYMAGIVRLSTVHSAKGISAFHASFLAGRINSTSTQQKILAPVLKLIFCLLNVTKIAYDERVCAAQLVLLQAFRHVARENNEVI